MMDAGMARHAVRGAVMAVGLGLAAQAQAQAPLNVLATVGMIADVAQNVSGACATVSTLVPAGADPHLYKPTASDVGRLQSAEVILHAGFGLEGQLGQVLERMAQSRTVVAVGPASIPPEALIAVDEMEGVDPHLWMDPALWALTVPTIANTLSAERPDCAGAFEVNAATYAAQLGALHEWVGASLASIPPEARTLVSAHDAFGYFVRAHDLEQVAIQGLSTESEASIADIRAVAEAVAATGVPAVFIESTVSPRTIEAMVEAVRAAGGEVAIGGVLYSDAMGEAGTASGTYVGMIHANTVAITTALGGTPAPLPAALEPWAATWGLAN